MNDGMAHIQRMHHGTYAQKAQKIVRLRSKCFATRRSAAAPAAVVASRGFFCCQTRCILRILLMSLAGRQSKRWPVVSSTAGGRWKQTPSNPLADSQGFRFCMDWMQPRELATIMAKTV